MHLPNHFKQILRYGIVGVLSNSTLYIAYLVLTHSGMEAKKAMSLLYLIGLCVSFLGNRKWTFAHQGNMKATVTKYLLSHASAYALNFLILFVFVDRFGYAHQWVQFISIFVIAGYLFILFKFFVFRT
jgi:putative flippase GtrA